jgi:phage-related protein
MIESMGTDAGNKFKDKFEEASGGIGELSGVGGGLPMSDFNGPMGPEIENPELPAPELEGIDFSGWTDSFFNWIAEINMTLIETIGTIASGIYMTIVSILDPIIGTFQTVFGSIGEIVSTVFSGIGSIISDIWNNIIFPIFSGIWNIINNQIIPIFLFLFDIGKWVFQGIGWAITETWNNFIKPVFETVWGWITNTLVPKFIEFKDIVVGVWDNVSEKISEVWDDKLYPIFDSIRSWITDTLIPKFSEIKETITGLWDTIKNKVTEVWDWVADKVKGFLNKIIDGVNVLIRTWNTVKGLAPWAKDSPPVGEVKGLATGGITDGPTIAGEGGYPEFVIPTDPKYKNSAISLAAKASKFVGAKYSTPSIPKGVVTGGAGGSTTIYVDTFIGEEEWFAKMAETHDVKIGKKKAMNSGSQGRVISRYNANNRGAF